MLNVDSVGRDMVYVVGGMLDDVDTMIHTELPPTCNRDSFSVAVLPEGLVPPGDETGEEPTGLHHDATQDNLTGGVWQHRVTLESNLGIIFSVSTSLKTRIWFQKSLLAKFVIS